MQKSIKSLLWSLGLPVMLLAADAGIAAEINEHTIKLG